MLHAKYTYFRSVADHGLGHVAMMMYESKLPTVASAAQMFTNISEGQYSPRYQGKRIPTLVLSYL